MEEVAFRDIAWEFVCVIDITYCLYQVLVRFEFESVVYLVCSSPNNHSLHKQKNPLSNLCYLEEERRENGSQWVSMTITSSS